MPSTRRLLLLAEPSKEEEKKTPYITLLYQIRLLYSTTVLEQFDLDESKEYKILKTNNPIDTMDQSSQDSIENIVDKCHFIIQKMKNQIECFAEENEPKRQSILTYFTRVSNQLAETIADPSNTNKNQELMRLLENPDPAYLSVNNRLKREAIGFLILGAFLLAAAITVIILISCSILTLHLIDPIILALAGSIGSLGYGGDQLTNYRKLFFDKSIAADLQNPSTQNAINTAVNRIGPGA